MMQRADRGNHPSAVTALLCLLAMPTLAAAQLVADFTGTPVSGTNPLVVSFTDTTTGGTPVLWSWSFGDGSSANGQNPVHLFAGPGTFTVVLTVFGAGGVFDVESKPAYITVAPAVLDVDFVANPASGLGSVSAAFTDTTSGGPVDSWLWTFGDGVSSSQQHPTHSYGSPGTYTVTLTASIGLQQETHVEPGFITVAPAFAPPVLIGSAWQFVNAMHTADLDRDSDPDLIAASSIASEIAWFENLDGSGSFGAKTSIPLPAGLVLPDGLAVADLDGDGYPDVVACDSSRISWVPNQGDPGAGMTSFGTWQTIDQQTFFGYRFVDIADIDGDGDGDVLSAAGSADTIAWHENTNGAGLFGAPSVIESDVDLPVCVVPADLDGDGDPDVVAASLNDASISWYENTDGAGAFGPRQFITTSAPKAEFVEATDLDGDGDLDLVAVTPDLVWFENTDGAGTFGPEQVVDNLVAWNFAAAADFDNDGDVDVMAAGNRLAWFDNIDGLGNLQPGPQFLVDPINGGDNYVVTADIDRDGDADVVSFDLIRREIEWWPNIISPSPWTYLGGGVPGVAGEPALGARGTLDGGAPLTLSIGQAPPDTLMLIWLSFTSNPLAVLGGTLYASPPNAQFLRSADAGGEWSQSLLWPSGLPSGVDFWLQCIVQDASVPAGLTLSNAVTATTP